MTPARWAVAGALVLAGLGVVWTAGPYLHAERMLDAAVVPPGSMQVFFLPGGVFAQPSQEPACAPLIDQTRYWIVPGDLQDIASFLRAHAPPGIPNNGAGQLSTAGGQTVSYDVIDAERGNSGGSPAELDFTVAALGAGMAGIRADAEVVPADATCSYSGGPAAVPAAASHGNSVPGSRRLPSRPLDGGATSWVQPVAERFLRDRVDIGAKQRWLVHGLFLIEETLDISQNGQPAKNMQ